MPDEDNPKPQLPEGSRRPLTPGEIALAKTVFGSSIDYSQVRINHWKHNPWQEGDRPMAPDGSIYYPPESYKDDFSKEDVYGRADFLHEMTHVWQKQNKLFDPAMEAVSLWWNNGLNYGKSYDLDNLSSFKDLREYNMEQQGELVKNFYLMRERQKQGPDVFKPVDYAELDRSPMRQMMLRLLTDAYHKDPESPYVKMAQTGFLGPPVVFDKDGTAHYKRVPLDEQRHAWEERHAREANRDKVLTRIMANFAEDPNYINKCPIVALPTEDSRVVPTGPKTTGMG